MTGIVRYFINSIWKYKFLPQINKKIEYYTILCLII